MLTGLDKSYCALAFLLVYITAWFRVADQYHGEFIRISANALFLLFLTGVSYFFGKFYCSYWKKYFSNSFIRPIFERLLIVGVGVLPVVPVRTVDQWTNTELVLGAITFVMLMDWRNSFSRLLDTVYSIDDANDVRVFFWRYPPENRTDMFPLDLFFLLMTGIAVKVIFF